jgi:hypothetical protein
MDFNDVKKRFTVIALVSRMTMNSDALEMYLIFLAELEAHRDCLGTRTVKMLDRENLSFRRSSYAMYVLPLIASTRSP